MSMNKKELSMSLINQTSVIQHIRLIWFLISTSNWIRAFDFFKDLAFKNIILRFCRQFRWEVECSSLWPGAIPLTKRLSLYHSSLSYYLWGLIWWWDNFCPVYVRPLKVLSIWNFLWILLQLIGWAEQRSVLPCIRKLKNNIPQFLAVFNEATISISIVYCNIFIYGNF